MEAQDVKERKRTQPGYTIQGNRGRWKHFDF